MLHIKSVFPEDAGIFTCRATNPAGVAESSAELFVEGKWLHLVCSMQLCDWLCKITSKLRWLKENNSDPNLKGLFINNSTSATTNASLHDVNESVFNVYLTCLMCDEGTSAFCSVYLCPIYYLH